MPSKSKRVLFVEDYPIIQELYAEKLKQAMYHLTVANNGEEALKLTKTETFDYILLDMLTPKMSGLEFLEAFQPSRPKETTIIVLSDFDSPESIEKAKSLGVDEYWIKAELTPSELVDKLNDYHLRSNK